MLLAMVFVLAGIVSAEEPLSDGIYSAIFETDSTMFAVNEAHEGRGKLTVKDGEMTIHVTLKSKSILNLFPGLAEDAKKEGAELLMPSKDEVTYSDGYQDTAYGFDIPVPYLDETFDLALIGKKGKWYDHKVSVSDPQPIDEAAGSELQDGEYICEVALSGGSGKASVDSPVEIAVSDGNPMGTIVWSSPYYEYMLVDGERYEPVQKSGNSTFVIPIVFDTDMPVSASTVAMSQPHLIDYTLHFDSETLTEK